MNRTLGSRDSLRDASELFALGNAIVKREASRLRRDGTLTYAEYRTVIGLCVLPKVLTDSICEMAEQSWPSDVGGEPCA